MVILNQSMETYNKFNHIKVHSQYSICEGALKIDELSDFLKKLKLLDYRFIKSLWCFRISENISKSGTQ